MLYAAMRSRVGQRHTFPVSRGEVHLISFDQSLRSAYQFVQHKRQLDDCHDCLVFGCATTARHT